MKLAGERSDEELSRLGGAGVEALFARHHAALYRYCVGLTSQGDDAADVMQTVWERAFVTFSRHRGTVQKVRPWLYTVARNECLDAIRARSATRALDVSDVEVAGGVSPEDSFEQCAELAALVDDLGELSERQRAALILRELAGFEGQQLASALGTSRPRALGLVAEARRGLIELRSGRRMPCSSAQHALTQMRRRSRGVQAHLDSCADCQTFERHRRGRSLSSLAISPMLLVAGLAERLGALAPLGPQGLIRMTAATALAAGSIGLVQSAAPAVHAPPQKAAIQPSAAEHRRAESAPRSRTPDVHDPTRTAPESARRVAPPPAGQAQIKTRPPAASTPSPPAPTSSAPPAPPVPRAPVPPANASPPAAATPPQAGMLELTASVDATVKQTRVTTQQVGTSLHSTLNAALGLLRR